MKKESVPLFDPDAKNCPDCGESWVGEPIPEEHRHWYGNKTHFHKLIGVYSRKRDRTVAWQCPFCGRTWERK